MWNKHSLFAAKIKIFSDIRLDRGGKIIKSSFERKFQKLPNTLENRSPENSGDRDMAWNNILGKRGEELAVSFLEQKGYQILEINWRYRRAEVDIIAKDGAILVFIEVKTRNNNNYGEPEIAVDQKKEDLLATAGAAFMRKIKHDWEIRFDIISIIYKNEQNFTIKHFEDAFFPNN